VPFDRLLVATANPGKLRELAALFEGVPVTLLSLADLPEPLEAPEESGATFAENARLKALAYARASGLPCLADDSGFAIAALDGAPGVLSARAPGGDDAGRVRWAYGELDARGSRASAAAFVCAMALATADGTVLHETEGRVEGEIAPEPRGTEGFGYDPMFFFPPAGRTFAEMTRAEKAAVSHRGAAARAMRAWLAERP
jgi:XTP/dITP diphosphohydrolase